MYSPRTSIFFGVICVPNLLHMLGGALNSNRISCTQYNSSLQIRKFVTMQPKHSKCGIVNETKETKTYTTIWTFFSFFELMWINSGSDSYDIKSSTLLFNLFMYNFPSFRCQRMKKVIGNELGIRINNFDLTFQLAWVSMVSFFRFSSMAMDLFSFEVEISCKSYLVAFFTWIDPIFDPNWPKSRV